MRCTKLRGLRIVGIALFALIFWGCANKLNVGYYSTIEKKYIFNANAPIVVMYDKSDLLSSSYVDLVVYQLQLKGFNSVYKQGDLPLSRAKNVIYVRTFRSLQAFPSMNFSYSNFDDGVLPSCYWYGNQFYCSSKVNRFFAITGYSESLNYLSSYHFTLDWYDLNLKKRILYIDGSIHGKTCGYGHLFRDLIIHTIARIDLSRSEHYQYYVDLPYYWVCN